MSIKAKIVVAVPTYNRAHYLRESLINLKDQTYQHMKVLVLDNASTDGTSQVFEEVVGEDPRFYLSRNESTIPALDNFKLGLKISESDYFMWRADDDLSDKNYVEALADALDQDLKSELAFSNCLQSRGNVRKTYKFPEEIAVAPFERAVQFLPIARPTWIYGLWRRASLEETIYNIGTIYPYLWASDHATMLPTMMRGRFSPVSNTQFHQRIVGPQTYHLPPRDLLLARKYFMRFGLSVLRQLDLTEMQRKQLRNALVAHVEARVAPLWQTRRRAVKQIRRSIRDKIKSHFGIQT